ncbi:UNVERIFIED_CONTAM: Protein tmed8 [Gekko kuhli]
MAKEKNARMVVKRGEVVTVRVPTHPDGKRVCWEFATEDYDIGFGVYFDWTPVTSTAITVQVSESSDEDEDDEEEFEGPIPVGDVERGSKSYLRNRYGEIMPVYRRDSHREVQLKKLVVLEVSVTKGTKIRRASCLPRLKSLNRQTTSWILATSSKSLDTKFRCLLFLSIALT